MYILTPAIYSVSYLLIAWSSLQVSRGRSKRFLRRTNRQNLDCFGSCILIQGRVVTLMISMCRPDLLQEHSLNSKLSRLAPQRCSSIQLRAATLMMQKSSNPLEENSTTGQLFKLCVERRHVSYGLLIRFWVAAERANIVIY
jgi:hypothetical protein